MKKVLSLVLLSFLICGVVSAASLYGEYKGHQVIKVTSNGTELKPSDVPAIEFDNRTLVPISLLEQIGLHVTWDGSTQTVDVEKPEPQVVQSDFSDKKKYAELADYYIQMRDLSDYIKGFADEMDYYQQATWDQNNKMTPDDLYKEYVATIDALNKGVKISTNMESKESSSPDPLIRKEISDLHDALVEYESAYKSLLEWERSLIDQNVNNQSLIDFNTHMSNGNAKIQDANSLSRSLYRVNMDKVLQE